MSIPEYHCTEGHAIQPSDWEAVELLRSALRDALSDLEWIERSVNGSNFKSSILKARVALGIAPQSGIEDAEVNAEFQETGRMWFGNRSRIPPGYKEVMCQTHRMTAPCPLCKPSPQSSNV